MYTIDFTKAKTASTNAMKVNGNMIDITSRPYWKKDFLETSLFGYCNYIKREHTVFLNGYLEQKIHNIQVRDLFLKQLTPDKNACEQWPRWYASFAGYPLPANAEVEFMQYNFVFSITGAAISDSISIYKTMIP